MTPAEFERRIGQIDGRFSPEADALLKFLKEQFPKKPSKDDHRARWLQWLANYDGPGHYKRSNWDTGDAKVVYNRLQSPPMLLWLAEVLQVPAAFLQEASNAAKEANRKTLASKSAAIRKVIPWQMIEDRLD